MILKILQLLKFFITKNVILTFIYYIFLLRFLNSLITFIVIAIYKSYIINFIAALESVWIELILLKLKTENWKHCSKIIFKCVYSTVRSIFNEKVDKKWSLWDPWIVHKYTVHRRTGQPLRLKRKRKKKKTEETQTQH